MSWIVIAILGWLVCSIIAAGTWFAFDQGEFVSIAERDYRMDMSLAWMFGLIAGPLSLVISIFMCGLWKHGWRLK